MTIKRIQVQLKDRTHITAQLFGSHFPMKLEPAIFTIAGHLSEDYHGGYWEFYTLSNKGFYMAPDSETPFKVSCENGFEGELSGDALGITACLYAYSHLSFGVSSETYADQYHLLREYVFGHPEVDAILSAID